jgi:hypothetical protein
MPFQENPMSMQKVSVMVPPLRPVAPGAAWVADAVSWLFPEIRGRSRLRARWQAVRTRLATDRASRRDARARVDLLALARRYQSTQPEFAKELVFTATRDARF